MGGGAWELSGIAYLNQEARTYEYRLETVNMTALHSYNTVIFVHVHMRTNV